MRTAEREDSSCRARVTPARGVLALPSMRTASMRDAPHRPAGGGVSVFLTFVLSIPRISRELAEDSQIVGCSCCALVG